MGNESFYVYAYLDPRKPGRYEYDDVVFDFLPLYIGKGKGDRIFAHLRNTGNLNLHLKRKIAKIVEQVASGPVILKVRDGLSEDDAFALERRLIARIGKHPNGPLVNIADGGQGPSGAKASEETRRKLSQALTGRPVSEETRERLRRANTGKRHSEETRKKIGDLQRGKRTHDAAWRENMSVKMKGRTFSEETRRKISEACKGRKMTEEQKAHLRAVNTGKRVTEETKSKLREANRGKKMSEESRRKLNENRRGKPLTPAEQAHLDRLHASRIGISLSDDHKQKIREAVARRWAEKRAQG